MRTHFLLYWLLSLAVLAIGAVRVCPGGECGLTALDQWGLSLANDLRSGPLDRAMAAVTWLGSLFVLAPLAGLAAGWRLRRGHRLEAAFIPLALIGSATLAHLVKLWVGRPRPALHPFTTAMPTDWSYPSAHTMQIMAAAVVLFLILLRHRTTRRPLMVAILLAVLVIGVGLSRIYLQVHFPSDVLAGGLAAAFWVVGLYALIFGRADKYGDDNQTAQRAQDNP